MDMKLVPFKSPGDQLRREPLAPDENTEAQRMEVTSQGLLWVRVELFLERSVLAPSTGF